MTSPALSLGLGRSGWSSSSIALAEAGVKFLLLFRLPLRSPTPAPPVVLSEAAELFRNRSGVPVSPTPESELTQAKLDAAPSKPPAAETLRDSVTELRPAEQGDVLAVVILKLLELEAMWNNGWENLRISAWPAGPGRVEALDSRLEPWMVNKQVSRSLRDLISEAGRGMFCGWMGSGWLSREWVRE